MFSAFAVRPRDARAVRLFINPPEKTSFGSFAVSPDGLRLVFVATDPSGKNLLWVRPLEIDAMRSRYPEPKKLLSFLVAG